MRKAKEQPDIFVGQLVYKFDKHSFPEQNAWGIIVSINDSHNTVMMEDLEQGGLRLIAMEMFYNDLLYLLPRELHDQLAEDEYE